MKWRARRALGFLAIGVRIAFRNLPILRAAKVARRLSRRARAAASAQQYQLAAALYSEALAYLPGDPRLHVQCGHMLKEAGDLDGAEQHYRKADQLLPDHPDIALQMGHFFKVAMRPDEAEAAYARALSLQPGWTTAAQELARIQGRIADSEGGSAAATRDWIVPELLPRPPQAEPAFRDRIHIAHLARRRQRGPDGMMKTLAGIEAIRGYCISSRSITALRLKLDGVELTRVSLAPVTPAVDAGPRKYVFNLWHDFTDLAPGRYALDLEFLDRETVVRTHRDHVLLARAAEPDPQLEKSDGFVPPPTGTGELVERIRAMPSMVRSTRRSNLPDPIRTILVQRADQLGDLACSVPAIRRLRALFPEARLIGLLTPANSDLARSLGLFDAIVEAAFTEDPADGRRTMSIAAQDAVRRQLAAFSIDVALDLAEVSETRPLLLLSGAKFLYGFKARDWSWLSAGFELGGRDPVNRHENISTSRKLLAMVEALGTMARQSAETLPLPPAPSREALEHLIPSGRRYAVLHTGARLTFSRWPDFADLAELLLKRTNLDLIVMGEDPVGVSAMPSSDRLHRIDGLLDFESFDRLLASAAVFVGNDSGPKHLAALRGTPVVSLHMARLNWSEWGQEGNGLIISRRVPCAGCGIHNHPEDCGQKFSCIRGIKAEEVYISIECLLRESGVLI